MHPSIKHLYGLFEYEHLPPHLREVSKPICDLARHMAETLPSNAELTVSLRHMLDAKDAAVRAVVVERKRAAQASQ